MLHPDDKFDVNTLPDPDLNPLINPLLAANMGRWAEVYFTTPPERRGEAVSELLRELRDSSRLQLASFQGIDDNRNESGEKTVTEAADLSRAAAESFRVCGACAHENPAEEKFCGMCGAALQPSPPQAAWTLPQPILPSFAVQSEPESVPNRYRLYVGAVLALVLAALVYMASRGTKTISDIAGKQSAVSTARPPTPPAAPAVSAQPSTSGDISPEENSPPPPVAPPVRV